MSSLNESMNKMSVQSYDKLLFILIIKMVFLLIYQIYNHNDLYNHQI